MEVLRGLFNEHMYPNNRVDRSLGSYKCRGISLILDVNIDFVGLEGVLVTEDSEDVFARAMDGFTQEEVGEEKFVGGIVQVVVSIVSGSVEAMFGRLLQLSAGQSGKLLVEVLQGLLADDLGPLPPHDHVEQDLGQALHPHWEVVHT